MQLCLKKVTCKVFQHFWPSLGYHFEVWPCSYNGEVGQKWELVITWLEGPIDQRPTCLNCILQDLFRDTPLDPIWRAPICGQICIFGIFAEGKMKCTVDGCKRVLHGTRRDTYLLQHKLFFSWWGCGWFALGYMFLPLSLFSFFQGLSAGFMDFWAKCASNGLVMVWSLKSVSVLRP